MKNWKPEFTNTYYYIFSTYGESFEIAHTTWLNSEDDKSRYSIGNCFKTKKQAQAKITEILKIF